jgi:zinc transport system substrate-binding protein/manganese/iron transport system substrate-binding protein
MRRPLALSVLALTTAALAKPSVIVSFQPYYSVVRDVAGPDADVVRLVPPGANPHEFEPRPGDMRALAKANLVVFNGLGLDEWMVNLARNSGTKARLLEVGERLEFTPIHTEDEHAEDEHGHEGADPHVWLDASLMARAATLIGEELARIDPGRAAGYRSRAKTKATSLNALHAELKKTLAPVRNLPVVTFHGAWAYWSRAYGPKIAAVVEPFPGKEPSARYVRDVVTLLRQNKARAVFAEPQLPTGPARVIAESAGARLYVVAPEGSAKHTTYEAMMRDNARVFLGALRK